MAVARVDGVDLYYEVHGSGETVVLTHGSWGDATGWQGVVPGLSEHFEVVTWDRRGHSRSSDGKGPGDFGEDAADLAGLIEHLDRTEAHVYGSSAGAIVTLRMAGAYPHLVSSVVVHEPPVLGLLDRATPGLDSLERHLETTRSLIEAGEDATAAEFFVDTVAVGPGAWEQFPAPVRSTFAANAGTYGDELANPDSWIIDTDPLQALDVPIQITVGTESPPLIQAATRRLAQAIPAASLLTLEGTGHVPYRTHPDIWLENLVGFYSRRDGQVRAPDFA